MSQLKKIHFSDFNIEGKTMNISLSYQIFGQSHKDAPVVLVNHALTGNSNVTGKHGWWSDIIGPNKVIDTNHFSVLAFNIPGNGYGEVEESFTERYKLFTASSIAKIFLQGLEYLNINKLHAIIGGSVGGGIAWHLAALKPDLAEHLIPIASHWKSSDWLIANCFIQDRLLNNSNNPIADARLHAMTLYRTPESFTSKFNRTKTDKGVFNVESWLNYHGERLTERFQLSAYKMINQVLKTIDIAENGKDFSSVVSKIKSDIHIITINSDLFFKPEDSWESFVELKSLKDNVNIGEIKSIHGHDAFLIEYQQLIGLLKPIFNLKKSLSLIENEAFMKKCS